MLFLYNFYHVYIFFFFDNGFFSTAPLPFLYSLVYNKASFGPLLFFQSLYPLLVYPSLEKVSFSLLPPPSSPKILPEGRSAVENGVDRYLQSQDHVQVAS